MADYEQAKRGFEAGVCYGTHLFNAMPPLQHREPGLIGALFENELITVGLIADGIHVHPTIVKLSWQILGSNRLTLVSDAMTALGMPPGTYSVGDFDVTVDQETARLADGTLAGSILSLDQALRNLIQFAGCSLTEALLTITATPADLLGISGQRGRIAPRQLADLVLLTPDLEVELTIVEGQILYSKGNLS
jgi:N-acetylglucosamine-6-phosphate deacetylase